MKKILTIFSAVACAAALSSQNMIENGFGELGDNTNFSAFTFDPLDFAAGSGSFSYSGSTTRFIDTAVLYEPGEEYRFDYYVKADHHVSGNRMYTFVDCLDVDGHLIYADNYLYISGTTTKLAQDLTPGDTYVYL